MIRPSHVLYLISLAACAPQPPQPGPPGPAGIIEAELGSLSEPVVTVSAREVRVAFPVDTSDAWGWPARNGRSPRPGYSWTVRVNGVYGPAVMRLSAMQRDSAARTFSTLEDLVAAGYASLCNAGMMIQDCGKAEVTSTVEHNRVVLMIDDSAAIARLFGMRPAQVSVNRQSPDTAWYPGISIDVRYADPQMPFPDSATRADSARGWRRYEASITSISRYIAGPGLPWTHLWIAVGDTATLRIKETTCHYDHCISFEKPVGHSGWSVMDSSIVRLHASCSRASPGGSQSSQRCMIYALRPGRTTIGVDGVHGPSDTVESRSPPDTVLTHTIVVGEPVSRVVIVSRPDTVPLGEPVEFRVEALDRLGGIVSGAPVRLAADLGPYDTVRDATYPVTLQFEEPGLRRVVASFRELADTIHVMVVGRKR